MIEKLLLLIVILAKDLSKTFFGVLILTLIYSFKEFKFSIPEILISQKSKIFLFERQLLQDFILLGKTIKHSLFKHFEFLIIPCKKIL